jgi:AraC-like DNA-binding protein
MRSLHEIGRAGTRPLSLPACRDHRLVRVADALIADPADARDLGDHALAAGASVRTLARLFRAETGMSFQQWRRQLRMTEALARIAQGVPVVRVAAAVGYASVPAFGAAFRTTFGVTPSTMGPTTSESTIAKPTISEPTISEPTISQPTIGGPTPPGPH